AGHLHRGQPAAPASRHGPRHRQCGRLARHGRLVGHGPDDRRRRWHRHGPLTAVREASMVQIAARRSPAPRLRELGDDEFRSRYDCDRFTATVLAHRFRYVVAHMSNQFRWHAFSSYIRDAADMCGMFSGPPSLGYPMAAVSETLPLFYGSIPDAVRI